MSDLVVRDEVLVSLSARVPVGSIPCLNHLKLPDKPGCSTCPGKAKESPNIDGESVRICLTQLGPEDLQKVKTALGADNLIVYLITPGFKKRNVL